MRQRPELEPEVAETAPMSDVLTDYDRKHFVTYLRILDATAENAAWEDVARLVLRLDPIASPDTAHRAYQSHLERAQWMTRTGYRDLLHQARTS